MRSRRLRKNVIIRDIVRETRLCLDEMVYPLFVTEGIGIKNEIEAMPGNFRFSVDTLILEVDELWKLGIKSILIFGIPLNKDEMGRGAYEDGNIVARAIEAIKNECPNMYVIADVCLCEYTSHGHCGVLDQDGYVNNDETLPYLAKSAISYAKAGADMIAPSDMMDFRIGYIRNALDEGGFELVPIMAYSAKFSSAFYGPFREAAGSCPQFGDRKAYQMDCANKNEAIKEILQDIDEGADIIMIKPALAYLDIIKSAKEIVNVPVAAYNVSGEYSMLVAASKMGWIDLNVAAYESLIAIKRAGADIIITYFAKAIAMGEIKL